MRVELSDVEWAAVEWLGAGRYEYAVANAVPNRAGSRGQRLEDYMLGVAGELAAARALNRYPTGLFSFAGHPDVGTNIEVRCSRSGHLIVHQRDADIATPTTLFVLVAPGLSVRDFDVSRPVSLRTVCTDDHAAIAAARCQYGIPGWWVPRDELRW